MVRSRAHGAHVCDCCLFFGEALLAMQVGGAGLGEQAVYKAAVQIGSKSTGLRSV